MPVGFPSVRLFESRKFFNVSSMFVASLSLKSDSRVFGLCPANLRIVIKEAARYGKSFPAQRRQFSRLLLLLLLHVNM